MVEGPPSNNVYISDLPPDVDEEWLKAVFSEYGTVAQCRAMQAKFDGQRGAALVRFATAQEAQWVVENLNGGALQGTDVTLSVRFATNKAASAWAASKGQEKGGGGGWSPEYDYGWGDDGWGGYGKACGKACGKGCGGKACGKPCGKPWGGPEQWPSMQHRMGPYEGGKGPGCGPGPKGGKGPPVGFVGQGASCSSCDVQQFLNDLINSQALPGLGRKPEDHCLYVKGLPFNTTDEDLYRIFSPFGAIPPRGLKANVREDGTCSGVAWVDFCEAEAAQAAIAALNGITMPDGVELHVSQKKPRG